MIKIAPLVALTSNAIMPSIIVGSMVGGRNPAYLKSQIAEGGSFRHKNRGVRKATLLKHGARHVPDPGYVDWRHF